MLEIMILFMVQKYRNDLSTQKQGKYPFLKSPFPEFEIGRHVPFQFIPLHS